MKLVKSAKFAYTGNEEVTRLLETFRSMVNDAIRVGLESKTKSRFSLVKLCYHDLRQRYGLHQTYAGAACEVAFSIIKKHQKWQRRPYAGRLMLKIDDCRAYKLSYLLLRIPIAPGHYTFLQLRGGEHQLSMLRDPSLKLSALLITPDSVDIMVSKEVLEPMKTEGKDAYDLNIANVTGVSTSSKEPMVYDVSDIVRFNKKYAQVLSHFRRNDRRIGKRLAAKYGRKRRNRTKSLLHVVSKRIVQSAAKDKHTIVLEKLTHIRKRHERGRQRERRATRHAINTWPFWILQKAIKYKAAWEQIPVEFIDPKNTSRTCSACGSVNKRLRFEREWRCPSCGAMLSRDVNAARNLLNRSLGVQAMRFVAGGLVGEAMVRGAPRGAPPIVDASQPGSPSAGAVSSAESVVQLGRRK